MLMLILLFVLFQMPHHCCVPQCTSNTQRKANENLSFHKFPEDVERQRLWIRAIRRDVGKDFNLNKHTKICSLHFTESCYELQTLYRVRRRLKSDAVPSVFQWATAKPPRRRLFRDKTHQVQNRSLSASKILTSCVSDTSVMEHSYSKQRAKQIEDSMDNMQSSIASVSGLQNETELLSTHVVDSSSETDSLQDIEADPSPMKEDIVKQHKALLLTQSREKFTVLRFCNSDADITLDFKHIQQCVLFFIFYNQNVIFCIMLEVRTHHMESPMNLHPREDQPGHYRP